MTKTAEDKERKKIIRERKDKERLERVVKTMPITRKEVEQIRKTVNILTKRSRRKSIIAVNTINHSA